MSTTSTPASLKRISQNSSVSPMEVTSLRIPQVTGGLRNTETIPGTTYTEMSRDATNTYVPENDPRGGGGGTVPPPIANFTMPCMEQVYYALGLTKLLSDTTRTRHTEMTCNQALADLKVRLGRVEKEQEEAETNYKMASAKVETLRERLTEVLKVSVMQGTELVHSRDRSMTPAAFKILLLNIKSEISMAARASRRFESTCEKREAILNSMELVQTTVESQTDYVSILESLDKKLSSIASGVESFKTNATKQAASATSAMQKLTAIQDGNNLITSDINEAMDTATRVTQGGDNMLNSGGNMDEFQKFLESCQAAAYPSTSITSSS